MKRVGCLWLIGCLLIGCAGCAAPPPDGSESSGGSTTTTSTTQMQSLPVLPDRPIAADEGNSALNIDSGAWAVEAAGYTYYILDKQIYKEELASGHVVLLLEDSRINKLDSLSVWNGWLYFTCMYFGGRMQGTTRMRVDGTDWEKIGKSTARFYLKNGVLYYEESVQESGAEYRYYVTSLDADTGRETRLLDLGVGNRGGLIGVEDGAIYYTEKETGALCRYTPEDDTTARVETADTDVRAPRVYAGRVYFLAAGALAAADFESGSVETVGTGTELSAFHAVGGRLLTVDTAGELRLWEDTEDVIGRRLADSAHSLNVWGETVYYQADGRYFCVLTDGSAPREITAA